MYDVMFHHNTLIKRANQGVQVSVHLLNFSSIITLTPSNSLEIKISEGLLRFQAHDVQQTVSLRLARLLRELGGLSESLKLSAPFWPSLCREGEFLRRVDSKHAW